PHGVGQGIDERSRTDQKYLALNGCPGGAALRPFLRSGFPVFTRPQSISMLERNVLAMPASSQHKAAPTGEVSASQLVF
ncbi:MAG: hypothetical protein ACN6OO_07575, partial [Pseudomonas putida]